MKALDIKLSKKGVIYDIDFADDGDFDLEYGFDTYINIALLSDERADSHQVLNPYHRRGWWGKIINNSDNPDLSYGSKLWLLTGRSTQKQKNNGIDYAKKSLEALIIENEINDIDVSGELNNSGLELLVNFIRENENPSSLNYKLWENTMR